MDVNNVKSQMRKGMLEYCVLLLLYREATSASVLRVEVPAAVAVFNRDVTW